MQRTNGKFLHTPIAFVFMAFMVETYGLLAQLQCNFEKENLSVPTQEIRHFLDAGCRLIAASIRYEKSNGILADLETVASAQNEFDTSRSLLLIQLDIDDDVRIKEFLDEVETVWKEAVTRLRGHERFDGPTAVPQPPRLLNKSQAHFSDEEIHLLNMGPNFVPSSTERMMKLASADISKSLRKTERLLDVYHYFADIRAPRKRYETLEDAMLRDQAQRGVHPDSVKIFTKAKWNVPAGDGHPETKNFSQRIQQHITEQRSTEIRKSSHRQANYPPGAVSSLIEKLRATSTCTLMKVDGANQFIALDLEDAYEEMRRKIQDCTEEASYITTHHLVHSLTSTMAV